MNSKFLVLFLFFVGGVCLADETQFECTVTLVHAISENGEMVTETEHLVSQRGTTFKVDRATGAVSGDYFLNSDGAEKVTVINEPAGNAYYAVYESSGPVKMVGYIYIASHRNRATMPFTYTTAGEYVYSGYCN